MCFRHVVHTCVDNDFLPLVSMGVLVLLVTVLGAKSKEMSLNGSTVVDTALRGGEKERKMI